MPAPTSRPFESPRFFTGRLLAGDDLAAEQAYARGKSWLHAASLHGWGVVCGLRVEAGPAAGDVSVAAGMAVDGFGRELPVHDAVQLDVAGWALAHGGERIATDDGPALVAHVVLCHEAVPDRPMPVPVPAGDDDGTPEFSRVVERGRVHLVGGPAPAAPAARHPRLAQLLGVVPATDALAVRALEEIDAAGPAERSEVQLRWFGRLAAEDTMDLDPGAATGGAVAGEKAAGPPIAVPLAELRIALDDAGSPVPGGIVVDNWVRRALLRHAELAELLVR